HGEDVLCRSTGRAATTAKIRNLQFPRPRLPLHRSAEHRRTGRRSRNELTSVGWSGDIHADLRIKTGSKPNATCYPGKRARRMVKPRATDAAHSEPLLANQLVTPWPRSRHLEGYWYSAGSCGGRNTAPLRRVK